MKRITQIVVGINLLMLVGCGGDAFLDSIDTNRYAKDLKELPVPVYVSQMTVAEEKVVSEDVAGMIQYFDDKAPKQLAVSSILSMDVLARMMGLAQTKHVVQIDLAAIYADAQLNQWLPTQIPAVLERVLQKKNTENTVFFMVDTKEAPVDWKAIKAYRVVVEAQQKAVIKDLPYKFIRHSDSVTREELEAEKENADALAEAIMLNSEAIKKMKEGK